MTNRLLYFAPLGLLPLMALAQQSPRNAAKSDNPYMVAALIFVVTLIATVAIIGYFNLQQRGRIIAGLVCGSAVWIVTASIAISAGVGPFLGLEVASGSAIAFMILVIRYGGTMAAFFRKNDPAEFDADQE